MPSRLAQIVRGARKLKEISLRRCQLEDVGARVIFEKLSPLMYLKRIDLSDNTITNHGVELICPFIGFNKKTALKVLNLSHN